jgi:hypothetical protein
MGSFEPLERGDSRLNTRYVNLWFLVQNALVLRQIDFLVPFQDTGSAALFNVSLAVFL